MHSEFFLYDIQSRVAYTI